MWLSVTIHALFSKFFTGFMSTHLAARDVRRGEKRSPVGVPDRLFLPVTLEGCLRPELGVARGVNILAGSGNSWFTLNSRTVQQKRHNLP